jgi:CRP-like cAMP-binding protein
VLEGFCGRYNTFKNGERQISAIYVCGDAPDLYSVFQPIAAFDLEALTDLTIFRIPHSETRRLIEDFPAITEAFARYFVSEANIFSEWLANIGGKEAKQNVAHLFCELAFRMGAARSESFSFRLPIRQGQIAQACGVSAVHINRSLKVLRERELMTCEQYVVHVKSWQGLTAFAEFDPRYLKAIHPLRLTPMRSAP